MPGLMGSGGKPLASLSSTLLARKGQARPAMRPQGFGPAGAAPLDDLGWNDMGADAPAPTPITAAVAPDPVAPPPPVLAERAALREEIEAAPAAPVPDEEPIEAVRSVSLATAGRLQRETAHAGRAAFTLRLDAERHLRLRLASAVTHRSAQQLVAHALDQLLVTLPAVELLRAQLPAAPAKPVPGPTRKRKRPC